MFNKRNIFFIFIGLFVASCGYRFAGGGDLPGGIKSIYIKTFANRTSETGIENFLTGDVIYEFTRSGKAAISKEENAEASLSGIIRSLTIGSVSRKDSHTSRERRVALLVDLKLTGQDGSIIWVLKGVSANEAYAVSSDKSSTEHNKRAAIKILSKRMAEKIYYRLTDNF